jgi:hypothetical protein
MTKPADGRTAKAREWLNKKHFTADSGLTLDCLALMPDSHALGITIGQLAQILAAYGSSAIKEAREECARAVCQACRRGKVPVLQKDLWIHTAVDTDELVVCGANCIRALGER